MAEIKLRCIKLYILISSPNISWTWIVDSRALPDHYIVLHTLMLDHYILLHTLSKHCVCLRRIVTLSFQYNMMLSQISIFHNYKSNTSSESIVGQVWLVFDHKRCNKCETSLADCRKTITWSTEILTFYNKYV